MTKTTITLEGTGRSITSEALLDMLATEAQRLDQALAARDRTNHPKRTLRPWRRMRQIGRLLDAIGWGRPLPPVSIRIDPERELPLAIVALRRALAYTEDNAKDARLHGQAEDAIHATARLHDTWETLISLEVQRTQAAARTAERADHIDAGSRGRRRSRR